MSRRKIYFALLLAALPARGQFYSINGGRWNNPVSATLDTMMTNSINRRALEDLIARNAKIKAAARAPDAASYVFRPSGPPRMAESIAAAIASAPEQRKQYAQVFSQVLAQLTEALRKDGDPYDLSKAMSLYIGCMYQVLHPDINLDERVSENLLRQVRTDLMKAPAASAANRLKQDLWESLIIFAGFAHAGFEKSVASRDAAAQKVFRAMAEEGLRSLFHVEPSRLRLDSREEMPLGVK